MGAGVSVVKEPPSDNFGVVMSCENCSVRFSVLKRKKTCAECRQLFCAACAQKVPTQTSIRRCERCSTLVNGNYNREDLNDYKAKELRQFLTKREIAVNNCTEKSDFIDLIMQYSNNSQYRAEQAQRENHLQILQERMRLNMSPPIDGATLAPPPYSTLSARIQPQTTTTVPPQQQQSASSTSLLQQPQHNFSAAGSDNIPAADDRTNRDSASMHLTPDVEQEDDTVADMENDDQTEPLSTAEGSPKAAKSPFMKLSQVESLEAISDLTTRQLKEILAGNFVDYKGCVEKKELVQKVERLWKEHQTNLCAAEDIHEKGSIQLGDTELCKICMDKVVDCVLLECGHMLTCTQCGKQLAECPICRQYVVRVVHVFKS